MAKPTAPAGVWKLNLNNSPFVLRPAPKSSVIKVQRWEDGVSVSTDTIDAAGNNFHLEVAYKFNGRDYPVSGSPIADTISARRISDWKTETVWKKKGAVVMKERVLTSVDGKTLCVIRNAVGSLGRPTDELWVYEAVAVEQPILRGA
jgi:hypothetical protein